MSSGPKTELPLARIKRIMRADPEVKTVSADAVYAVARATELFLKHMLEQASIETAAARRKAMAYQDVALAVKTSPELEFLLDIVPMKKVVGNVDGTSGAGKRKVTRKPKVTGEGEADESTTAPATKRGRKKKVVDEGAAQSAPAHADDENDHDGDDDENAEKDDDDDQNNETQLKDVQDGDRPMEDDE